MNKKGYKYRLVLEYLKDNKDEVIQVAPLSLEFENHDDIFTIIKMQEEMNLFGDKGQAIEFAIGLKLFSEVMLKNRDNLLFEDLIPAFRDFMKKLKSK